MGEHNRIMFFSHHYIRFSEKYICFSGKREALSHESLWVSPTSLRAVGLLTSKMFLHILRVRKNKWELLIAKFPFIECEIDANGFDNERNKITYFIWIKILNKISAVQPIVCIDRYKKIVG
jgi:hypothetical protein